MGHSVLVNHDDVVIKNLEKAMRCFSRNRSECVGDAEGSFPCVCVQKLRFISMNAPIDHRKQQNILNLGLVTRAHNQVVCGGRITAENCRRWVGGHFVKLNG